MYFFAFLLAKINLTYFRSLEITFGQKIAKIMLKLKSAQFLKMSNWWRLDYKKDYAAKIKLCILCDFMILRIYCLPIYPSHNNKTMAMRK